MMGSIQGSGCRPLDSFGWSHPPLWDVDRKRSQEGKKSRESLGRVEITTRPGTWQVDVTAAEIQRERASCITAGKLGINGTTGLESTGQNGAGEDPALKPVMVTEKLNPSVVHVLCKYKICLLVFLGSRCWGHVSASPGDAALVLSLLLVLTTLCASAQAQRCNDIQV